MPTKIKVVPEYKKNDKIMANVDGKYVNAIVVSNSNGKKLKIKFADKEIIEKVGKNTIVYDINKVKQGGGTKLTKLNKIIKSKKGSMLVFDNTYKNSNKRHPLSEHAGMPVLKGDKYAFNLWFRECNSKKLYSEYNPQYYKNLNIKNR